MLSTTRRLGLAAALLLGLSSVAQAEGIKPDDLESNRQTCMFACVQKTGDEPHCTAACDCSVKGLAQKVTADEYYAAKTAIDTGQQPAASTVEKLAAISKSCAPLMKD